MCGKWRHALQWKAKGRVSEPKQKSCPEATFVSSGGCPQKGFSTMCCGTMFPWQLHKGSIDLWPPLLHQLGDEDLVCNVVSTLSCFNSTRTLYKWSVGGWIGAGRSSSVKCHQTQTGFGEVWCLSAKTAWQSVGKQYNLMLLALTQYFSRHKLHLLHVAAIAAACFGG